MLNQRWASQELPESGTKACWPCADRLQWRNETLPPSFVWYSGQYIKFSLTKPFYRPPTWINNDKYNSFSLPQLWNIVLFSELALCVYMFPLYSSLLRLSVIMKWAAVLQRNLWCSFLCESDQWERGVAGHPSKNGHCVCLMLYRYCPCRANDARP